MSDFAPWPHQVKAVVESDEAEPRSSRICICTPTGGGKTFIAANKIHNWIADGHKVAIYTNRRALITQLCRMMGEYGIEYGIRAARHPENLERPVQICSIQTEIARMSKAVERGATWELHGAQRVLVDEFHLNAGPGMIEIMNWHVERGGKITGLTATPLDLGHACDELIQAGTMSELRACGALLPALVFAPDEPDFAAFKKLRKKLKAEAGAFPLAEVTEAQSRELIMTPTIFGRVWEWYNRLNPEHDPTILFAPDVEGSVWFAKQFEANGVRAAHIGAAEIYVDGESKRKTDKRLADLLEESKAGELPVLCNRFVLREGIDAPWLAHGILATIFGSLSTYLQSVGRLLRSYPGMECVRIQDHGANYLRFGSPNADRYWSLEYTDRMMRAMRTDRLRDKKETEPIVCPECKMVLICGRCRNCGWKAPANWTKARAVVSTDGTLRMMHGDVFRPHLICKANWGPAKWERIFWASYKNKKGRTFRNAAILFAQDSNWNWPDPTWPWMPVEERDWYEAIADVPLSRLIQKEGSRGEEESSTKGEPGLWSGDYQRDYNPDGTPEEAG